MNKTVLKNKTKGVGVSVLRMLFLLNLFCSIPLFL